jgi:hypothetical protein
VFVRESFTVELQVNPRCFVYTTMVSVLTLHHARILVYQTQSLYSAYSACMSALRLIGAWNVGD